MTYKILTIVIVLTLGAFGLKAWRPLQSSEDIAPQRPHTIDRGHITVWERFEGTIESEDPRPIASTLSQRATLIELAPEGRSVKAGEVIARFDPSTFTQQMFQLEKDLIVAKSELDRLQLAKLPMALSKLEREVQKLEAEAERELKYLENIQELIDESLMSPEDYAQQENKAAQLVKEHESLSAELKLTRDFLHPSLIDDANANLASAQKELEFARAQQAACVILAPKDGLVMYKPLHMDSSYRTVRAGDALYRNQVFMIVADMTRLIAQCYIPENKLAAVTMHSDAAVTPLSYPSIRLPGKVRLVGTMAHPLTGKPDWQKYVKVELELANNHPSLRSGMSAFIQILSHHNDQALRIPRAAVSWKNGQAFAQTWDGSNPTEVLLELGAGNESHFEVQAGLNEADIVILP